MSYFLRTWALCSAALCVSSKQNSGLSGLGVMAEESSLMIWTRLIGQVGSVETSKRTSLICERLSLDCVRMSLVLEALCLHRPNSGDGADVPSLGLLFKSSIHRFSSTVLSLSARSSAQSWERKTYLEGHPCNFSGSEVL